MTRLLVTVFLSDAFTLPSDGIVTRLPVGRDFNDNLYFFPSYVAHLLRLPRQGALARCDGDMFEGSRGRTSSKTAGHLQVLHDLGLDRLYCPLRVSRIDDWVHKHAAHTKKLSEARQVDLATIVSTLRKMLPLPGEAVPVAEGANKHLDENWTKVGPPTLQGGQSLIDAIATENQPELGEPKREESNKEFSAQLNAMNAEAQRLETRSAQIEQQAKDMLAAVKKKAEAMSARDLLAQPAEADAPLEVRLCYQQTYALFLAGRMTFDRALDLRTLALRQAGVLDLTIPIEKLDYGAEAPSTTIAATTGPTVFPQGNVAAPGGLVVIPKTDASGYLSAASIGGPYGLTGVLVNDIARALGLFMDPRYTKSDTLTKGVGESLHDAEGNDKVYCLYNTQAQQWLQKGCAELVLLLADPERRGKGKDKLNKRECATVIGTNLRGNLADIFPTKHVAQEATG